MGQKMVTIACLLLTLGMTARAQTDDPHDPDLAGASPDDTVAAINSKLSPRFSVNGEINSNQRITYNSGKLTFDLDISVPQTGANAHFTTSADIHVLGAVLGNPADKVGFAIAVWCKGGNTDFCAQQSIKTGAAAQSKADKVARIGMMVAPDQETGQQVEKALRHLMRLALNNLEQPPGVLKQNGAETANLVGQHYLNQRDYQNAMYWFKKGSDAGVSSAEASLGGMYSSGLGVPKDLQKAVYWYQRAADAGNPDGEARLAWAYMNGLGVPRDDAKAASLYQKASDGGSAGAGVNLGSMYSSGRGVPKDLDKAVLYWTRAAEGGERTARLDLAMHYYEADDTDLGWKLFRTLLDSDAEIGNLSHVLEGLPNPSAKYMLGLMYYLGGKASKDSAKLLKASELFQKAAETGLVVAQRQLGAMYHNGEGVPADYAQSLAKD